MTTDEFPEDNSWKIRAIDGTVVAEKTSFTRKNKQYSTVVCLPIADVSTTYVFSLRDSFGDGLCCSHGDGAYKIIDDEGQDIFSSDYIDENFSFRRHFIQVPGKYGPNPITVSPTSTPTDTPTAGPTSSSSTTSTSTSTSVSTSETTLTPIDPPIPVSCKQFTIQVHTDKYPEDNSWEITDNDGIIIAEKNSFKKKNRQYSNVVCLPMADVSITYLFTFRDSYGDGVCCEYGNGSYKILDDLGQELISSNFQDEDFSIKEHDIEVPARNSIMA